MRSYPLGCIVLEDMLDSTGRDVLALLSDKERTDDPVPDEFQHSRKGILINKNGPYFIPFSPDPDGMLVEIDVLDIDIAELRIPGHPWHRWS